MEKESQHGSHSHQAHTQNKEMMTTSKESGHDLNRSHHAHTLQACPRTYYTSPLWNDEYLSFARNRPWEREKGTNMQNNVSLTLGVHYRRAAQTYTSGSHACWNTKHIIGDNARYLSRRDQPNTPRNFPPHPSSTSGRTGALLIRQQ